MRPLLHSLVALALFPLSKSIDSRYTVLATAEGERTEAALESDLQAALAEAAHGWQQRLAEAGPGYFAPDTSLRAIAARTVRECAETGCEKELLDATPEPPLDLLRRLLPRIYALRRGAIWDADAAAGTVPLGGGGRLRIHHGQWFSATLPHKLNHDLQQIEWLRDQGMLRRDLVDTWLAPAYRHALARAPNETNMHFLTLWYLSTDGLLDPENQNRQVDELAGALLAGVYNRAIFTPDAPFISVPPPVLSGGKLPHFGVLSQHVDWASMDDSFTAITNILEKNAESRKFGVVYADGVLSARALEALRAHMRAATVFHETKGARSGGHLGAYLLDGLHGDIFFQLASEMRSAFPRSLETAPLRNLWAYKYDPHLSGLFPHIDPARVNANIWLSDVGESGDFTGGGMVIWDIEAGAARSPEVARIARGWQAGLTPAELADPSSPAFAILASECPNVTIPHKPNRMVIFDSALPHATMPLAGWPSAYETRRVSLTLLFGFLPGTFTGGNREF